MKKTKKIVILILIMFISCICTNSVICANTGIELTDKEKKIKKDYEDVMFQTRIVTWKELYAVKGYEELDRAALEMSGSLCKEDIKIIQDYIENYDKLKPMPMVPVKTEKMTDKQYEKAKEKYEEDIKKRNEELEVIKENLTIIRRLLIKINDTINSIQYNSNTEESVGSLWDTAQNFLKPDETVISQSQIVNAVVSIGSLLTTIAVILFPALTIIMGIKFVLADSEGQGKLKTQLVGLVVSCGVTFSAYVIWKALYLVLTKIIK